MPSGHGHIPKETFCIENVLPGEMASEEIDDKRDRNKTAFRALYSRMINWAGLQQSHVKLTGPVNGVYGHVRPPENVKSVARNIVTA